MKRLHEASPSTDVILGMTRDDEPDDGQMPVSKAVGDTLRVASFEQLVEACVRVVSEQAERLRAPTADGSRQSASTAAHEDARSGDHAVLDR